jgi:hypothetical protein
MTLATCCGDLNDLQERLIRLLGHVRELLADNAPATAHLEKAPLVDQWSLGLVPAPCIVGTMVGHPIFRNRTRVLHSHQVVLIDAEAGWARTWSGFYRLGTRHTLEIGDHL